MATVVLEIVTGTSSYVPIKSGHFGFKGDLTAKSSNATDILIRPVGSSAAGIPLPAGATKICPNPTDLSRLEFNGNGNVLILDGNTDVGW